MIYGAGTSGSPVTYATPVTSPVPVAQPVADIAAAAKGCNL